LWWVLAGDGDGEALVAFTVGAGAGGLLTVCAGAVRANSVAKPTVAIAPSWVARQVSRDRRRSPAERAASGGSSHPVRWSVYGSPARSGGKGDQGAGSLWGSYLSRMRNENTTECVKAP
jgi:hypothetical protein